MRLAAYRRGEIPARGKPADAARPPGLSSLALAATPAAYNVTVMPDGPFLVIPEVSSERRDYVPIGWLDAPTIPSNLVRVLPAATPWHFAVLTSRMHMAWMRQIGGRLESRYRYSIGLVYNPFPWPGATPARAATVERLGQAVIDARADPRNAAATLADLYDPDTMPSDLRRAHRALDEAVDQLYRPHAEAAPFASDRERVEHLFVLYQRLVDPLETDCIRQNRRVARRRRT